MRLVLIRARVAPQWPSSRWKLLRIKKLFDIKSSLAVKGLKGETFVSNLGIGGLNLQRDFFQNHSLHPHRYALITSRIKQRKKISEAVYQRHTKMHGYDVILSHPMAHLKKQTI